MTFRASTGGVWDAPKTLAGHLLDFIGNEKL